VAQRICDRLKKTVYLNGESVEQRASIGVAWTINDGSEPDTLVARADSAMYASKRQGAGRPILSNPPPMEPTGATEPASMTGPAPVATTDRPAKVGA
jgi:GGDEF domain-containing protein